MIRVGIYYGSMPVPLGDQNQVRRAFNVSQKNTLYSHQDERILRISWKRAQRHTLNMISGLLAVCDNRGNPESRDTLTPNLTVNSSTIVSKIHHTRINGLRRQFQLLKVVLKQLQKGIDNDIYSTVDACLNACEMWKAIERLKQGKSINVQDLETNLYWEFGKFTSRDGESLESYYLWFYKMMNELVRNQCHVTNHQVNVQFLLQLQPEWQRFMTLVKQSQELKTVSYHKLYDILKATQNEGTPVVQKSGISVITKRNMGMYQGNVINQNEFKRLLQIEFDNSWTNLLMMSPCIRLQKIIINNNVFPMENEHPEQPESSNHIISGGTKVTPNHYYSLDICIIVDQDTRMILIDLESRNVFAAIFNSDTKNGEIDGQQKPK
ncbi:hypothetical protein Tco_0221750 [Tanacetum coccineum]